MLYFAAPLFNQAERIRNAQLASAIEAHLEVFLPQRDGTLLADMLGAGVPLEVAERRVFVQDCAALRDCSAVLAILDGAHLDEGVAFEIGFARALGKTCLGLQTDIRRTLPSGNNPMIGQALSRIFTNEADLMGWVCVNAANLVASAVA